MATRQRTLLLAALGLADLTCFALRSLGYGDLWRTAGAAGLLLWLVLLALVPLRRA